MPKHFGVTLSPERRAQLRSAMKKHGNANVARMVGFSINTLKSAAGGFTIHRGNVALIESWLDKNAGHSRTTCKERT